MSVVAVKVIPKSGRVQLKFDGDTLKVWLTVAPEDGKANGELVRILAKKFDIPRAQILIRSGLSSRNKNVDISGITLGEMKKTLA